jgi:RNA polymerase primary sigma factor
MRDMNPRFVSIMAGSFGEIDAMKRMIRPKQSNRSPLETYFHEIRRTPLLNAEDEQELACRVEEGRSDAREQMVSANLRLVVSIARGYTGKGLELQELIAEGNLGLIRAVEDFNPAMKTRFSTYASYWIKQSIRLALANKATTIRIPVYMFHLLARWHRAAAALQTKLGRAATQEELGQYLNLSAKRLEKLKRILCIHAAGALREQNETLVDSRADAPDTQMSEADDRRKVFCLLDELEQREAIVLRMRFGLTDGAPKTLDVIGKRLGLTRERIRQIECEALTKIRRRI